MNPVPSDTPVYFGPESFDEGPTHINFSIPQSSIQSLYENFRFNLAFITPALLLVLSRFERNAHTYAKIDKGTGKRSFDLKAYSANLHEAMTQVLTEFNLDSVGLKCSIHLNSDTRVLTCLLRMDAVDPSFQLTAADFSEDRVLH